MSHLLLSCSFSYPFIVCLLNHSMLWDVYFLVLSVWFSVCLLYQTGISILSYGKLSSMDI